MFVTLKMLASYSLENRSSRNVMKLNSIASTVTDFCGVQKIWTERGYLNFQTRPSLFDGWITLSTG